MPELANGPLLLNAKPYMVARERGRRMWKTNDAPSAETDLFPFSQLVSFGHLGMGSSAPAVKGQHDYGTGVNTEVWDEQWPDTQQAKLGLALDQPVTSMMTLRDSGTVAGPNSPGFMASNSTGAGVTWSNPSNVTASDNSYATATGIYQYHPTHDLKTVCQFTGIGAASVTQVAVDVEYKWDGAGGAAPRLEARLVFAGTVQTTVVALATASATTDTTTTLTFSTGLPSVAQTQSASFGCALRVIGGAAATSAAAFSIDRVQMQVTYDTGPEGYYTVSSASDDTSISQVAWSNPSNVATSNTVYATAACGISAASQYLYTTIYGLDTPATADRVLGVLVEAQASWDNSGGSAPRLFARLIIDDVIQTAEFKVNTPTTSLAYLSYGGNGDVWSAYMSPTKVEETDFGVALYAIGQTGATGVGTISVDHVRITVYTTPFNRYLYLGAGAQLAKVNLAAIGGTAALSTVNTKTFTHGNGAPFISDLVALKDGAAIQVSDALALVGFGADAPIAQINTVGHNTSDTYQTQSTDAAYAGVFTLGLTDTATETRVFKSVGGAVSASTVGKYGAFSNIQSAAISTTATDYTDADSAWGPSTPYKAGNLGTPINRMAFWNRSLVAGKPEGVIGFSGSTFAAYHVLDLSTMHDDNGNVLMPYNTGLVVGSAQDLLMIPRAQPRIGLSTLISNTSPIQGRPVAAARYGDYLFCQFYDGTDSWLCRGKPRDPHRTPNDVLWYPMHQNASYKSEAMIVTDDGVSEIVYCFYATKSATSGKYDAGYFRVPVFTYPASSSNARYALSGTWYGTEMGDPQKRTVLQRLVVGSTDCTANDYWTLAVAFDSGSFNTVGANITSNGRITRSFTGGTNDTGYIWQVRTSYVNSANTNHPRLTGAGILAEGMTQPETVRHHTITVLVGGHPQNGYGGEVMEEGSEQIANLKTLISAGAVDLIDEDYYGDQTARKVLVKRVAETFGPQDSPSASQRYAEVEVVEMLNT